MTLIVAPSPADLLPFLGRVMGLETQLRETQQGLVTALAASGISPDAAMKDSGEFGNRQVVSIRSLYLTWW
jgi:hypothetical protein